MKIIEEHINTLVQDIVKEINSKNVDVVSLCTSLSLEPDVFVNLIKNPVRNVSLYIEILEEVRNERN